MAKLISERYEITKAYQLESVTITVEINDEDELTIQTHDKKPQFTFTRSKSDRVRAMGLALQEAADLVEDRKVRAA